jgi:hypothetical protein
VGIEFLEGNFTNDGVPHVSPGLDVAGQEHTQEHDAAERHPVMHETHRFSPPYEELCHDHRGAQPLEHASPVLRLDHTCVKMMRPSATMLPSSSRYHLLD